VNRRAGLWLVLVVFVALGCRSGFGSVTILYDEPFEEACDGIPCGWVQVRGEVGQARYGEVGTLGDHGLALRGAGVTVQGPGTNEETLSTVPLGGIRLVIEARCEVGSSLGVSVAIRNLSLDTISEYSTRLSPTGPNISRTSTLVTQSMVGADAGMPDPIGGPSRFLQVLGITIEKTGDSVCEIGAVQLQDAGDPPQEPRGC